jgi:hypothetical protein
VDADRQRREDSSAGVLRRGRALEQGKAGKNGGMSAAEGGRGIGPGRWEMVVLGEAGHWPASVSSTLLLRELKDVWVGPEMGRRKGNRGGVALAAWWRSAAALG